MDTKHNSKEHALILLIIKLTDSKVILIKRGTNKKHNLSYSFDGENEMSYTNIQCVSLTKRPFQDCSIVYCYACSG